MTLEIMLLFMCLCLVVENSAAQCQVATILPSEVAPSIPDEFFTAQLAEPIEKLKHTVASLLQEDRGDVYSVAVVYRNSTIFSAGLVDTPFRIGSVTKAFVAMGALLLRKQGALSLDDPVKKLLPGFSVINPFGDTHDITLRELMGHTSGLPRNLCSGLFCQPDDNIPEDEALASIAKMQLARPPWSSLPVYSNLGFAILGHAWEKATSPRKTWSQFLRDKLLTPLQMRDTGVPADLGDVELASGNVSDSYPANYSIGWQAPAGDMYSTAADLAKFLKFLLHPDASVLSDADIREMTQPSTVFPDRTGFALPWEFLAITNRSTRLITKNGGLGTYRSIIGFHPESQLGVVVLTSGIQNASSSDTSVAQNDAFTDPAPALAVTIMEDLIPEVQAVHATFISSLYAGIYVCNRTAPVESAHDRNITLQVLGGNISVTTMTPDRNLVLEHNVSIEVNGAQAFLAGSRSLVLKPGGARANSTTFWSSPASCLFMALSISSDPEVARPNFPDSVNFFEFSFQGSLLRWPALGGICYKA